MGEINADDEPFTQTQDIERISAILNSERKVLSPNAELEKYLQSDLSESLLTGGLTLETLEEARAKVQAAFPDAGFNVSTMSELSQGQAIKEPLKTEGDKPEQKQTRRERVRQDLGLHLRGLRPSDIDQLVEVDLKTFSSVYKNSELSREELKADLAEKFKMRYEILGSKWMRVLEKNGKLAGCIVACPTSKSPQDFESWEKTTDNGTLKTTYDPNGDHLYVVSLAAMPEVSGSGGGDMLMANMIGRIIGGNYSAYFESRVPGLKRWVLNQCRPTKTKLADLTSDQLDAYAQQYFGTTITQDDKQVPIDPLLRMYKSMGCSFFKIVPNAYQDPISLNYGVVCQFDNPMPKLVRNIAPLRRAAGGLISLIGHSNLLTQKFL